MHTLLEFFSKIPVWALLSLSATSVILGDFFGKYWSTNSKTTFFFCAVVCYILSGIFYVPTLLREGLIITSLIWSLLSIIGFLLIGFVLFNETVTATQAIGIVLGIISLVLVSI